MRRDRDESTAPTTKHHFAISLTGIRKGTPRDYESDWFSLHWAYNWGVQTLLGNYY
jgi:hypothetical protein